MLTLSEAWEEFAYRKMYLEATFAELEAFANIIHRPLRLYPEQHRYYDYSGNTEPIYGPGPDWGESIGYFPSESDETHMARVIAFSRYPVTDVEFIESFIFGDWTGSSLARRCDEGY